MNTILVTATAESTGKTAVALALGLLAGERGATPGYMKPKGTRLQSHVGKTLDRDPMLAREVLDLDAEMHDMEPVVYSPTFVDGAIKGREDPDELRETVRGAFDVLARDRDPMLVEGGGRLTTGGIVRLTDPDVADLLDAGVVLVTRYGEPRDVDEVLAAADAIGDRLAGVVFNAVPDADFDYVGEEVVPFLDRRGVPVLGVLPRVKELAGVTVTDLAAELGADVITGEGSDDYVERFVVGAMSSDSALRYFRRTTDAAVITGGDRSDVVTVALEAPGVTCLVLTGGFRLPDAVVGTAESRGVPLLRVGSDTRRTVERVEEIIHGGRTRDARTVERMRDLLFEHADVDAILGPCGDGAAG